MPVRRKIKQFISLFGSLALPKTTTYATGLLQTKAYRILKHRSDEALKPYGLTPLDWALLGALYELPQGLRLTQASEILGVEASMISLVIESLERDTYLTITRSPQDRRVKIIQLTEHGRSSVPKIEQHLRASLKPLLAGASKLDVLAYLRVLHSIVEQDDLISHKK